MVVVVVVVVLGSLMWPIEEWSLPVVEMEMGGRWS